jgi:hypothetical protein
MGYPSRNNPHLLPAVCPLHHRSKGEPERVEVSRMEMVLRIDQQEVLRLWQACHTAKEI